MQKGEHDACDAEHVLAQAHRWVGSTERRHRGCGACRRRRRMNDERVERAEAHQAVELSGVARMNGPTHEYGRRERANRERYGVQRMIDHRDLVRSKLE